MKLKDLFIKHLPADAVEYCIQLHEQNTFIFKISRKRSTKLGDFKYDPATGIHQITVNNDLNPYSFLITYVHEVAHHVTYSKYKRSVNPHGVEWKENFKNLMLPILNPAVFPENLLRVLAKHLKNPKASSCNDSALMKVLSNYNAEKSNFLADLPIGTEFMLGKRKFKKESLRRTRFVCMELSTGKKYLISKSATVSLATSNC